MTHTYTLPKTPEDIVPALLKHLNSLDTEIMLNFYDPEGMLVDATGVPQVGRDAIRTELKKYFSLGLQMQITARHIFVAGDIASLVLDWSYQGTTADGREVNIFATANDIARRGADGHWRYLIDNPFGTALRAPA
jgi:uncharacterized protein (TIGR02246 family)